MFISAVMFQVVVKLAEPVAARLVGSADRAWLISPLALLPLGIDDQVATIAPLELKKGNWFHVLHFRFLLAHDVFSKLQRE